MNQLAPVPAPVVPIPAYRFVEFFTTRIRNPNKRPADQAQVRAAHSCCAGR